ncbi:hypothetical protein V5799_012893 [Amblyomma americanum]|uniref:Uncharacterized protein n=1 Tax=Amblyomma americanum TaxID=6943 RepID=A0AAQ4E7N6_AMBAM
MLLWSLTRERKDDLLKSGEVGTFKKTETETKPSALRECVVSKIEWEAEKIDKGTGPHRGARKADHDDHDDHDSGASAECSPDDPGQLVLSKAPQRNRAASAETEPSGSKPKPVKRKNSWSGSSESEGVPMTSGSDSDKVYPDVPAAGPSKRQPPRQQQLEHKKRGPPATSQRQMAADDNVDEEARGDDEDFKPSGEVPSRKPPMALRAAKKTTKEVAADSDSDAAPLPPKAPKNIRAMLSSSDDEEGSPAVPMPPQRPAGGRSRAAVKYDFGSDSEEEF